MSNKGYGTMSYSSPIAHRFEPSKFRTQNRSVRPFKKGPYSQKVSGPLKCMNVSIKHRVEATPKLFKTYRLIEHKRVLRLDWDHYRQVDYGQRSEQQRAS